MVRSIGIMVTRFLIGRHRSALSIGLQYFPTRVIHSAELPATKASLACLSLIWPTSWYIRNHASMILCRNTQKDLTFGGGAYLSWLSTPHCCHTRTAFGLTDLLHCHRNQVGTEPKSLRIIPLHVQISSFNVSSQQKKDGGRPPS